MSEDIYNEQYNRIGERIGDIVWVYIENATIHEDMTVEVWGIISSRIQASVWEVVSQQLRQL